ncbi:bifunctional hydroxymethylpyrimidine kinase/phosphomethylpyrimidine kinase [Fervidobacterium riparium]|uniref:Hydroxymethylpyrimidine/phosphomethylpyrimidine kinase n=1 Tax=Fervidobacterium gondwanense DSM 13020 TaxID=1121883 RepID=A0A1M7TAT9_FERGO|nr:thiamine-phosphate synthase family protein [Fervidobacterium gondwanense]UXF00984.1 thiamine-phosphate synthase [Fervidobacterium riparium]SHN67861.1 hydroxymethylpyrimidine/phosphomethylpyrimidine kinase [Fervidobacterium gondwanense DSM 13020]
MFLVISGFDPSAGAGILQDIKSLSLLGITAFGVVSCHTVQNSERVYSVTFRKWEEIDRELSVLPEPEVVKIGLISPEFVRLIREKFPNSKIVWNIILSSSSGYFFESEEVVKEHLKYADYIILNNIEAQKLNLSFEGGNEKYIITFGHSEDDCEKIKLFYSGRYFEEEKVIVDGNSQFHGTGCAFSSLFAGFLYLKYPVETAINESMKVMNKILSRSAQSGYPKQVQSEKLSREWMKYEILEELEAVVKEVEEIGSKTVPEVGQNISYALPWSKSEYEVAKFPGRIRLKEGKPTFVSGPSFKDKSHTARMVLTIKEFAPHIRCASNIRYEPKYIENALRAGLNVFKYDRNSEPEEVRNEDGKSMQHMIKSAIEALGKVPDIIYDEGWYGKEAMIRIFGRNPKDVIHKIMKMLCHDQ